jgi:hypothetical protein
MKGIDWIFFTHHKRFVDDVCTYGSFENVYAGLQLFMVDVRTNLFATPSLRVGTMLGSERYDGDILNFFLTSHTFRRWCMRIWKLRKYLRGSTIIHGRHTHQSVRNAKSTCVLMLRISEVWWEWTEFFSHVTNVLLMMYAHMEASKIFTRVYSIHGSHTHQSARNAKSTRGYVRADAKGQRGMMGIAWNFHTSQTFRRYCALIRKLCKYLCAPANITENTVAISQRFHVEKITPWKNVWKNHTLENPLTEWNPKSENPCTCTVRNGLGSRAGVGPI